MKKGGMNYGSIDNPRTKEARLFAYLTHPERLNRWQSAWELACYLDQTTCLHTYVHGVRVQLAGTGFEMEHWCPEKGKNFYRVARVEQGQMELAV